MYNKICNFTLITLLLVACKKNENVKTWNKNEINQKIEYLNNILIQWTETGELISLGQDKLFEFNKELNLRASNFTSLKGIFDPINYVDEIFVESKKMKIPTGFYPKDSALLVFMINKQNTRVNNIKNITDSLNKRVLQGEMKSVEQNLKNIKDSIKIFQKERKVFQKNILKINDSLELHVLNNHFLGKYYKVLKKDLRLVEEITEILPEYILKKQEIKKLEKQILTNLKVNSILPLLDLSIHQKEKYKTFYITLDEFLLQVWEFKENQKKGVETEFAYQEILKLKNILIHIYEDFN